ncbi:MAG: rod shape-determining protein MreC [Gammaproteobacteria bacterium]|nr:rod shape-determining protein MreC [Gammaproteobacteria bacterium]
MKPYDPLFNRGPSTNVRLVVFVMISILLMSLDHRQHHLDVVRQGLSLVTYPLQFAVHAPFKAGKWVYDTLALRSSLLEENNRLRTQQLVVQARLGKYQELEAENQRLRRLLDSSVKVGERVLIAEVLSVEMDPFSRKILLNKGSRAGVFVGQSLLDAHGIMGQVVHVNPLSCTALLITDPSHALPVQLNRNGLRSVAIGSGAANTLELSHLPNNADVKKGDLVVTSGLGGRFPSGYPVGHVTQMEIEAGRPFARAILQPGARLERNREVLLVWTKEQPDADGKPAGSTEGVEP